MTIVVNLKDEENHVGSFCLSSIIHSGFQGINTKLPSIIFNSYQLNIPYGIYLFLASRSLYQQIPKEMNRETTVLEFSPAIEAGYEPKNYSYYKEEVKLGSYKVKLDFMLWSKTYVAINCFFTILDSQKKISLSVYKKPGGDELFLAGETEVRFLPFGTIMNLTVEANQNGKPVLTGAFVEGNVTGWGLFRMWPPLSRNYLRNIQSDDWAMGLRYFIAFAGHNFKFPELNDYLCEDYKIYLLSGPAISS